MSGRGGHFLDTQEVAGREGVKCVSGLDLCGPFLGIEGAW